MAKVADDLLDLGAEVQVVGQRVEASDRRDAGGDGEVPDGVQVLLQWLYHVLGDPEPGVVDLHLCKSEFLLVDDDTIVADEFQVLHRPPVAVLHAVGPEQCVVDLLDHVGDVLDEVVISSCVRISARAPTLWRYAHLICAKLCAEIEVFPVILMHGD